MNTPDGFVEYLALCSRLGGSGPTDQNVCDEKENPRAMRFEQFLKTTAINCPTVISVLP